MYRFLTLIRFNLRTARRALVVAATTPNIDPFPSIIRAAIVIMNSVSAIAFRSRFDLGVIVH
jgi:hypothetical protein